jgi:CheY-like chemotaxis protein
VALVDAGPDDVEYLESLLEGRCYNVLLLDSRAHAHAEIKRLRPALVVLCTSFRHLEPFQLLTMLKLDRETRDIPFVTLAVDEHATDADEDGAGMPAFPAYPAPLPS